MFRRGQWHSANELLMGAAVESKLHSIIIPKIVSEKPKFPPNVRGEMLPEPP